MVSILLVCSAGMSTSLLVTKMEDEAAKQGIEARIWAVSEADSQDALLEADIVCLGPQVRFLVDKMKERVNNEKPVMVIDMASYGTMNGAKVLQDALNALG